MIAITNLRPEVEGLRANVQRLDTQNEHLWRRMLNYRSLGSDRKELEALGRQMDEK